MVEKDDYDRAWERRMLSTSDIAKASRRRGAINHAVGLTSAILVGLGLIFVALGAEGLAIYNACFANPVCYLAASGDEWEGFFAVLAGGVVLAEAGALLVILTTRGVRYAYGSTAEKDRGTPGQSPM